MISSFFAKSRPDRQKKEWAVIVREFLQTRVIDRRAYKLKTLTITPTRPHLDRFMAFVCMRYVGQRLFIKPEDALLTRHDLWSELRYYNDDSSSFDHSSVLRVLEWLQERVTDFSIEEQFPSERGSTRKSAKMESPLLMAVEAQNVPLIRSLLVLSADSRATVGSTNALERAKIVFSEESDTHKQILADLEADVITHGNPVVDPMNSL